MNFLLILILFIEPLLVSIFSKKVGYIFLTISSIFLGIYTVLIIGLNTLTFFYLISMLVLILTSCYSIKYDTKYRWLAPLFTTTTLSIVIILISQNYLEFLAGWELMSISGYLMIGLYKKGARPSFVFWAFGELSTVFIIAGMAYAYVLTGTFNFTTLPNVIPLVLVAIGFFIKMGIFPFAISDWLPIAHSNSPANSSAILSALMTLMGVYGIIRFTLICPSSMILGIILMVIGAFTIFFAALLEYVSENTKMMLGYSTIENNAAILIAIGLLIAKPSGIAIIFIVSTILMLSMAHSIGKTGLFLISGSLNSEDFASIENGKDKKSTLGIVLSSASLSGLLPTIGGVGIWMLLESLFMTASVSSTLLDVIAIIVGAFVAIGEAVASGAMVKFISFTNLFKKNSGSKPKNTYPVLITGIMVVALGVISVFLVNNNLIIGNTDVGIPNGLIIASLTNSNAIFGVISPVFIAVIVCAFFLLALLVFGRPKVKRVDVWNNGVEQGEEYTSFAFANNIRIMMAKILRTKLDAEKKEDAVTNPFWTPIVRLARAYKEIARKITWKIMNSSMRWYIIYIVVAFFFAIMFVIVFS